MRSGERDLLLILLASASGAADAWSYLGPGHAFVANMTGNTVLIGLAVFTRHDLLNPLLSLTFYALGTALAAYMTQGLRQGAFWPRRISYTLLFEAVLMAAAGIGWAALHLHPNAPHISAHVLLGDVAFAVGLQSGAMLQLRIPGIVTTYITGTWTNLVSGMVRLREPKQEMPVRRKVEFEERLLMQCGTIAVYLASAMLVGWLSQSWPAGMGAVSSTLVLFVAVYGLAVLKPAALG